MAQHQKIYLFLVLGLLCFFISGCKEVDFEKGELVGAGNLEFKINELDRKTIYDGKRIQLVGYISPMWRQQGSDVSLFLSEMPNSEDHKKQIIYFKVREGAFPNRVRLGETGKTEKISTNMVNDDHPMERVEFDPEKMLIYDNNGIPHKIDEKIAVSGTVKYSRNVNTNEIIAYESSPGVMSYGWSFIDIRIDPIEKK